MMKIRPLLTATLMLVLSAPVIGAIGTPSPRVLARDMDDVQSLGVIYINRNRASEREANPACETPEGHHPPPILSSPVL
ncbi:hypothetical protein GIX45_22040 [Erwinia sp. CPCC 100877]|nr:hypothetical protein [Erwinia sp. CPCC 100877]